MNRARDEFLAGTTLAANQNRCPRTGGLTDKLVDRDHGRRVSNKPTGGERSILSRARCARTREAIVEDATDGRPQLLEIERLDEELHRAAAHRRDHRRHVVEGRHHHHIAVRMFALDLA